MDLTIRGLSKTYAGDVRALDDVSLTIPPGMYGLLGPNGAGKSTLMRIVATLQRPDAGSVHLGEVDVLAEPQRTRELLGYLPQDFGLYPRVSAEALLTHFAALEGVVGRVAKREVVSSLLKQTNLWDVRKARLGTFSGGMRQRFGIAVAMLGSPKLLVVDEPTAGLDPSERVRFLNMLSELGERAVVLLSTHIVEDVSDLCTRMAIIHQGRILLETEPQRAVERIEGRIWKREVTRLQLEELTTQGIVVSSRLSAGRSIAHVYAESSPGDGFEPARPDLRDVYFSVIAGKVLRPAA